jgi:hypothetical protein
MAKKERQIMKSEQGNNRPDPIPQAVCADRLCNKRLIYDQEEDWGLCQEHTLIKRINDPETVFYHAVTVEFPVKTSSPKLDRESVRTELALMADREDFDKIGYRSEEPVETILVNPQI